MQLKNLATNAIVTLPDDLMWVDEYAWSPAVASVSYLLNGALMVQSATKQAGRPITMSGAVDMAWIPRSDIKTINDWAAIPLGTTLGRFLLTLADARTFTVAFRHADTPLEAEPVLGFPATADTDFYHLTLRLMAI